MEEWPRDFRKQSLEPIKAKRKKPGKKDQQNESGWETVDITGGLLGAATLFTEPGGRFKWYFANEATDKRPLRVVQDRLPVYPPTAAPKAKPLKLNPLRLATLGSEFLEETYPDLHVPPELIAAELKSASENRDGWDPYFGNCITSVDVPESDGVAAATFLAFPTGEVGEQLDLSPIFYADDSSPCSFHPNASPATTFSTPIQQITNAKHTVGTEETSQSPVSLVVRTYAETHFLRMDSTSMYSEHPRHRRAKVTSLAVADSSHTGERPAMDLSLREDGTTLLVNDEGHVFKSTIGSSGEFNCVKISDAAAEQVDELNLNDSHWKICWTSGACDAMLASKDLLSMIDLRSPNVKPFWRCPDGIITSIEGATANTLACAVTSTKIMWFDERKFSSPVLSCRHFRGSDRNLKAATFIVGQRPLTLLSSSRNSLIQIYDVSRNDHHLIQSHQHPELLKTSRYPFSVDDRRIGLHVLPIDATTSTIFEVSERGALYMSEIDVDPPESATREETHVKVTVESSPAMKILEKQASNMSVYVGPLGKRKSIVEDFSDVYKYLFLPEDGEEEVPNSSMEETYEILDKMENFQEQTDEPLDNILTLAEVALLCGTDPERESRTEFFGRNPLNTKQGRYVIGKGRLPLEKISANVSWSADYAKSLANLHSDFPPDIDIGIEFLEGYNKVADPDSDEVIPSSVLRHQTEACEGLALDLTLASRVYAPNLPNVSRGVRQVQHDSSGLASAAKALSLHKTEPAPFVFNTIRPVRKNLDDETAEYEEGEPDVEEEQIVPSGVRQLLEEWSLGEDPAAYVYRDPEIQDDAEERPRQRGKKHNTAGEAAMEPLLFVATQPPTVMRQPPLVASASASQTQFPRVRFSSPAYNTYSAYAQEDTQMSSQPVPEQFASTQEVPGRFGGRLSMSTGKKPPKKRVGGF